MGFPVGFACSQIKISSFFYAFTIINLLMVIKPHIDNKGITWLRLIGDNSFGIYYVHMFWIMISNKLLSSSALLGDILPLYQLVQLVFTLLFSCISIFITKKIIGEKMSRELLGF
jgi:peptidoglycan/LPS O-acetylase OafA/YrhL